MINSDKILILGAGCAGIGAAHTALKHNVYFSIAEAEPVSGGLTRNFNIDDFTFDRAIHVSFTKDPYIISLFDNVESFVHPANPYNYYKNTWIKHPVQNHLYSLPINVRIEIINSFISRPLLTKPKTYLEWLQCQYGKVFTDKFPRLYTLKYWTVEPSKMDTSWISNRMAPIDLTEMLRGAMSPITSNNYYLNTVKYPKTGGFFSFIEPLTRDFDIRTGKKAILIDLKIKKVYYQDGTHEYYDTLFSSIPLPSFFKIIKDVPPKLIQLATRLESTGMTLVSFGISRPNITDQIWFYIYDEDIPAARANIPSNKSPANAPENCSSIQFEVYHSSTNPKNFNLNDNFLQDYFIKKMECMGLASSQEVLFSDLRKFDYANVIFTHHTNTIRKILLKWLKERSVLGIGRFGEWRYFWSDDSFISGKSALEKVYGFSNLS